MVMCWALDCNHYNVREACKFFVFPKEAKERKRWIKLLRRADKPGTGARVCSCHFREGKRENGPEIFKRNVEKLFGPDYLNPEKKKQRRKNLSVEQNEALKMDGSKQQQSVYQTRKPILNNSETPTYLTTYQQFLSNQIRPYQLSQDTSTDKDQQTNDNTVLLENKVSQKSYSQTSPPKSYPVKSTNDERISKQNCTKRKTQEIDSNSVEKDPMKLYHRINYSRNDFSQKSSILTELLSKNKDSISPEESPVVLNDEPLTAYECTVCSFETIYEDVYKEHMRTHKRKETFHKCPRCMFKVRCKASVRKHMVLDDNVAYCGLNSYSDECKCDLDLHLKMHEDDRGRYLALDHSYMAK